MDPMGTPEIFLQNGPFTTYKKTTYSTAKEEPTRPLLQPKRHSQSRFEWPSPPRLQHQRALDTLEVCPTGGAFFLTLYTLTCGAHGQMEIGKTNEILWSILLALYIIYNQVAEIVVNPKDQFIMDSCIHPVYKSNIKQPMGSLFGGPFKRPIATQVPEVI